MPLEAWWTVYEGTSETVPYSACLLAYNYVLAVLTFCVIQSVCCSLVIFCSPEPEQPTDLN